MIPLTPFALTNSQARLIVGNIRMPIPTSNKTAIGAAINAIVIIFFVVQQVC